MYIISDQLRKRKAEKIMWNEGERDGNEEISFNLLKNWKKCVHHDKSKNHRKTVDVRTYHLFSLSPFPCCQGATVCVSLQNIMCQSLPFFANHCSVHREDKGAAGKRFLLCWEEKADRETDYCRLREATFWNVLFPYEYTYVRTLPE